MNVCGIRNGQMANSHSHGNHSALISNQENREAISCSFVGLIRV